MMMMIRKVNDDKLFSKSSLVLYCQETQCSPNDTPETSASGAIETKHALEGRRGEIQRQYCADLERN